MIKTPKTTCQIPVKLTIKTPERLRGVILVPSLLNLNISPNIVLVFIYLFIYSLFMLDLYNKKCAIC